MSDNWDTISPHLAKILIEQCHCGVVLFFLEDPEWTACYSTDKGIACYYRNLDKWELLTEGEKVSWDILYSLYGGWSVAQDECARRRAERA
jgi:hypothetical protein